MFTVNEREIDLRYEGEYVHMKMKHIPRSEWTPEMEANFEEGSQLIELEPDDLEEVEPAEYDVAEQISVGDEVTIELTSGDRFTDTVVEMTSYSFTLENKGYMSMDSFTDGPGLNHKVVNHALDDTH